MLAQEILWRLFQCTATNLYTINLCRKRKLIPLTEDTQAAAAQKFIVAIKFIPCLVRQTFHPENFHYTLLFLRISRPIKTDRMNLLFYGNVNTKFIKFSLDSKQKESFSFSKNSEKRATITNSIDCQLWHWTLFFRWRQKTRKRNSHFLKEM